MARSTLSFEVADWRRFLEAWSTDVLSLLRAIDPSVRDEPGEHSLAKGTLLREPASSDAIASMERRIGRSVPESYKRFLLASNGFMVHGMDAQDGLLRPTDRIGWLKESEPQLVSAWSQSTSHVPDDLYYYYGPDQDPMHLRSEYMSGALQISDFVDSAVVLLNPAVIDTRGEWEAWDFGNAFPGAYRYQSFEELMEGLRTRTIEGMRETVAFLPLLAASRT